MLTFAAFYPVARDKLPDAGSPYEGEGGTVDDSIEFVLENFVEANKLWVRMHGQVRAAVCAMLAIDNEYAG